jgi:hypothetical protein
VPAKVNNPFDVLDIDRAHFDAGMTGGTGPDFILCHHLTYHGRLFNPFILSSLVFLLKEQILSGGKEIDFKIVDDISWP